MSIVLKTTEPGGKTRLRTAKPGATLEDICEIAENEVYGGYAVYAAVIVDGEVYIELEG